MRTRNLEIRNNQGNEMLFVVPGSLMGDNACLKQSRWSMTGLGTLTSMSYSLSSVHKTILP